jgi:hypothetical protein
VQDLARCHPLLYRFRELGSALGELLFEACNSLSKIGCVFVAGSCGCSLDFW